MVVSVIRSFFCSRIHLESPSAPSFMNRSREPAGRGTVQSTSGTRASIISADLRGLAMPAEPFTMTSPRKLSTLVARSFFSLMARSSGCFSMNDVSQVPARKTGWVTTFSRNGILVFTPRTRNSWRERFMMWAASSKVSPHEVTLTRSES